MELNVTLMVPIYDFLRKDRCEGRLVYSVPLEFITQGAGIVNIIKPELCSLKQNLKKKNSDQSVSIAHSVQQHGS